MFGIRFASDLVHGRGRRWRKPGRYVPVVLRLESRLLLSTINEFPLPPDHRSPFYADQARITAGADGNVWFTDPNIGVGRITPQGSVTEFPDFGISQAITAGPDGNFWYSHILGDDTGAIGRITPDGSITHFRLPQPPDSFLRVANDITAGPDGNLWYTEAGYRPLETHIGRITPDGQITQFLLSTGAREGFGITAGPDDNLWFTETVFNDGGRLGRITLDGQITHTSTPASASIIAGPDGNVWTGSARFDDQGVLHIFFERIALDGAVTEFPLPSGNFVTVLTAGPDGNIWFTERSANQIGMLTPDGQITEYPLPTPDSQPAGITAGPDGNIWFTEVGSGQIGEFVLNDGGPGAGAAPAKSTPLAHAVHSAAVDAFFSRGQPDLVMPVVVNQQPALPAVDAGFAAGPSEAATVLTEPQLRVEAVSPFYLHKGNRAVMLDIAGLTEAL